MPIHLLGINHRTAPVAVREAVVFEPATLARALPDVLRIPGVSEAVIVSTCNRTEIYAELDGEAAARLADWIAGFHRLGDEVRRCFYSLENGRAARHLFAVACGLDSVVLGEPQILGQLKEAYRAGEQHASVGPSLSRVFQQAFGVAKQVRSETGIGASPVSVAYAAVILARKLFGGLGRHTALLVGAGDTIELAARHLQRQGIRNMIIANRSLARAADLAVRFNGVAISLEELPERLHEADLVITATRATTPVLERYLVQAALRARRRKPMCIIDVGVPRDVAADVHSLEDVYLYTVDDLEVVIEEGWQSRRQAATQAEQIIDFAVEQYERVLRTLDAVPTIRALRSDTERLRDETLAHARRLLQAGRDPNEVMEFLAHTMTQKFLHGPSTRLRTAAEDTDTELLAAAAELFGLDALCSREPSDP